MDVLGVRLDDSIWLSYCVVALSLSLSLVKGRLGRPICIYYPVEFLFFSLVLQWGESWKRTFGLSSQPSETNISSFPTTSPIKHKGIRGAEIKKNPQWEENKKESRRTRANSLSLSVQTRNFPRVTKDVHGQSLSSPQHKINTPNQQSAPFVPNFIAHNLQGKGMDVRKDAPGIHNPSTQLTDFPRSLQGFRFCIVDSELELY